MGVMIGQSIDCIEGFLTERNTGCISEERKPSMQLMIMQERGQFMNTPGLSFSFDDKTCECL